MISRLHEVGRYRYLLVEPFFPATLSSTLASARTLREHLRRSLVLPINLSVRQAFQLSLPLQWNVCLFECLRKSLKMAKDSSGFVRPRKREGLNIRPRLFLIDRVSILILFQRQVLTVTAVIPYIVLVQVLQNLPTPPKH